ncbi:hypothetical protein E3P99_02107 [Wallemia hederae]|uniref:Uncharacterized protein n=1 Tax=Wallemia hederae TaxID=1540922 RepID=A0A4T0FL85_9BASI|nr:hypothetical protein E3P99_02107 [Wallemia hederae]
MTATTLLETQSAVLGSRRFRVLSMAVTVAILWIVAQTMYTDGRSNAALDGIRYTRTINLHQSSNSHPSSPSQPSAARCSDPFSKLGTLHVDTETKHENNWVPFDKHCQPPRLMAALTAAVSGEDTSGHLDIDFVRNRTILVMGDSIARETVKYFCSFLGQQTMNLDDDHVWSPLRRRTDAQEDEEQEDSAQHLHQHHSRAPRESSLPNVCYIPTLDLMLIQSFHFGMDTDNFFAEKEQYNPPNNYEDRLVVHGRNLLDLISDTDSTHPPSAFEDAVPRPSSEPDLVEVSSSLWDLARFARIDIEQDMSTLTDLSPSRLSYYMDRMTDMLHATSAIFPSSQIVWRTSHYPADHRVDEQQHHLNWLSRDMSTRELELEHQRQLLYHNKPYFHSNRLFQLDQAARFVVESEQFDDIRLNEWGRLMFGQHAHQIDQLHPSMLPGGWLWGDTMLYELRKAVTGEV